MSEESDRIEKQIELKAKASRVWRALTNHREFGEWFGAKIDGPFKPGEQSTGRITYPGYEHIKWHAVVREMVPESLFSFTWHPYPIEPDVDYSAETPTLVEFRLEETSDGGGTLLRVTESGFLNVPAHRRSVAFRMNSDGWTEQMENIRNHVAAHP